jgi:hypothetical protein
MFSASALRTIGTIAFVTGALGVVLVAQARQGGGRAAGAGGGGPMPEVTVGGIQVAKVVVSKDDYSAKPFHADNGTTIVLWIKMPAGQGLIEIDEDTSLLQSFSDDKGTDLGGKFGSFPEEFKDGTGGIIDVQSTATPAAGATSLSAEGTVTVTLATGTRPVRVANVRIENDRKFMVGTTAMTIAEVAMDGEDQKLTLKLARQAMNGIKEIKFLDAKGTELEGRRTGGGYFNDAGEMNMTVKSALKTLTLEFEMWQGVRTVKVPFKVKAGIGLGGGF